MRLDFLIGDNPYSSTRLFAHHFGQALERAGASIRFFDIGKGQFYKAFHTLCNDPPTCTLSFSDITIGPNKTPLGAAWNIPHLSLFVDPALYFLHQLRGPFSLATCVDRGDAAYVHALQPRSLFLPHGVDRLLLQNSGEEKQYEAVMLGTLIDYEEVQRGWKGRKRDQLEEAAHLVLSPLGLSCLEALQRVGVEEDLVTMHHELDRYICGKDRVDLLRALEGIAVDIWGRGAWAKYFPDRKIHRSVPFSKALKIMGQAKLVINSSARFKQGAHERIFYAPAVGGAVLTGDNRFLRETFCEESLLFYRHGEAGACRDRVATLLAHEERRKEWVARARGCIQEHHTWDERARTLLDFLQHSLKTLNTSV